MADQRQKVLHLLGLVLLLLISGAIYFLMTADKGGSQFPCRPQANAEKQRSNQDSDQKSTTNAKFDGSGISVEDRLVRELQKNYGRTISQKRTQADMYDIRNAIVSANPDGMVFFHHLLQRAFADYAEEIMDTLDRLDIYNQWLEENEFVLSQMSNDSRMAALWEKRISLFGEDAYDIWADEMPATDARQAKFKETVYLIDTSTDMSIEEKLDIYQETLREISEGMPETYMTAQPATMTKAFFSIGSVQDELKLMDPDQRQMTINMIRREMGFSQAEVEKMEKLDTKRNARWENGLKYMAQREDVVAEFQGEELTVKLNELRINYFGNEAKTIELEEENDGFFRFSRPRYYGRN